MVHRDAVQVAQCSHAGLHAVQTGVGQLVLAVGAGQIHIVVAGRVDQCHLLGLGVHHSQNVHVAAGFFGQFTTGVHAAEVDDERLLGDLVGLGTGEQTVGHVVQRGQTLLGPDTAQRHAGAQEHREHPGHLSGHIVLLTALDQQPEQEQQGGQNDQIQHGQHLGAPQLYQRSHAEDALHCQQDLAEFRGCSGGSLCLCTAAARGRRTGLFPGRRRGGRVLRKKSGAVHFHGAVCRTAALAVHMPQGTVGIILHRKSPFERKAQSAGTMVSTARAGRQVAVWSSLDSQPKPSQMWSGQGESTKRAAPSLTSMCTV